VFVVQALLSLQTRAVPARHVPYWHVSDPLQTLPSLQDVPLDLFVYRQPDEVLHVSVVQGLLSLQTSAVPAAHVPD
jgi:hypothetical protein